MKFSKDDWLSVFIIACIALIILVPIWYFSKPKHTVCKYIVGEKFIVGDKSAKPHYYVFINSKVAEITPDAYARIKTGDTACVVWNYWGEFVDIYKKSNL